MKKENESGLDYTEEMVTVTTEGFKKKYLPRWERFKMFVKDYMKYLKANRK